MKGYENVLDGFTALHSTESIAFKKLSIPISKEKSPNLSEL